MPIIDDLADRVRDRARSAQRRVLIGIAGAPGSGKTTLAEALVASLGGFPAVAYVPMDGFHLADVELARLGRADRKGAPDTFDPGGYAALLARVAAGADVWAPAFERVLEQPIAQAIPVIAQTRIVVSEGNYLLLPDAPWRSVRAQFDEVWFCRQVETVRIARLVARHVQFGKAPDEALAWVRRSDDRNATLVAATQNDADLLVDLAGVDLVAG
jgi:pantothenate kinase